MSNKKVSIVIPVYNEIKTINKIVERVLKADTLGLRKEIIIVNDASTDGTKKVLDDIKKRNIKVFHHKKNKGKGAALRTGFPKATGDIILVQDADLEYHPKDFPKLISPLLGNKSKAVYGSRELSGKNKHSSIFFHAGGWLITLTTNLLYNSSLTDEATGYKAFKANFLKSLPLKCKRFEFCPEVTALTLKRGEKIIEVPISYYARHRHEGKKIRATDGIKAIYTLVKIKLTNK